MVVLAADEAVPKIEPIHHTTNLIEAFLCRVEEADMTLTR